MAYHLSICSSSYLKNELWPWLISRAEDKPLPVLVNHYVQAYSGRHITSHRIISQHVNHFPIFADGLPFVPGNTFHFDGAGLQDHLDAFFVEEGAQFVTAIWFGRVVVGLCVYQCVILGWEGCVKLETDRNHDFILFLLRRIARVSAILLAKCVELFGVLC